MAGYIEKQAALVLRRRGLTEAAGQARRLKQAPGLKSDLADSYKAA